MAGDSANEQRHATDPSLQHLARLVGTWTVAGGAEGRAANEWLDGGFFLIQHVDLEQDRED